MDRRNFLKRTTAAGLLLTAASCAPTLRALPETPSPDDMDAYLARMDRGMRAIAKLPVAGGIAGNVKPVAVVSEARAANERLMRDALASLYMVGSFHDVGDDGRTHPGMQQRMRDALPTMDRAVLGATSLLESMDDKQLAKVQQVLRERPEIVDDLGARIDAFGANSGISVERRLDLRTSMEDLAGRMRTQNPAIIVSEYTKKVRRVEAQSGIHAESERHLVARMGRDAFWRHQQDLGKRHLAWRERLRMGPPDGNAANPTLTTGAILLGVGASIEVVGLICLAAGSEGGWMLLGVTIGPIVLAIGLIVLVIGLIIEASAEPEPLPR